MVLIPPCYPDAKSEHHHPTGGLGACHPGAPWNCDKPFCVESRRIRALVIREKIAAFRRVADQIDNGSSCRCNNCGQCAVRRQAEHLRYAADMREHDLTHHPITGEPLP
jgi:hypothetical protein